MLFKSLKFLLKPTALLSVISACAIIAMTASSFKEKELPKSYIVSTSNLADLKAELVVMKVKTTHELAIINAVAVELTLEQLTALKSKVEIKVSQNHKVELTMGGRGKRKWQPEAVVVDQIDAEHAHYNYNFGDDVTIGFLDTGLNQLKGLSTDLYGYDKAWGTYDAINNSVHNYDNEVSGHGTHVASIAANSDFDIYGRIYGVAPNAAIVGIKAFDDDGKASYADVIRGIDWALQVKDQINLRILNMSFSGPVRSHYWDDPLNQAVMKAWQAGIVVVASAGNAGPEPMTIGVPGNIPYIITVGAMSDSYTTYSEFDDKLATFSSAGPTVEGFVKPDILAPGGHMSGLMSFDSQIVRKHPEFHDGGRYFEMSGTSQAAAVISGAVALMLTDNPSLTPDDVKCRLMSSAHAALNAQGKLAYSVFQQGAGVVNVADALASNETGCANQFLSLEDDLSGENHFYGPSNINADGEFYIEGLDDSYVWENSPENLTGNGLLWKTYASDDNAIWQNSASTNGLLWKTDFETNGLLWKTGFGTDGLLWKTSLESNMVNSISINHWVNQQ